MPIHLRPPLSSHKIMHIELRTVKFTWRLAVTWTVFLLDMAISISSPLSSWSASVTCYGWQHLSVANKKKKSWTRTWAKSCDWSVADLMKRLSSWPLMAREVRGGVKQDFYRVSRWRLSMGGYPFACAKWVFLLGFRECHGVGGVRQMKNGNF